jgi:hypothetical protein
MGLTLCDVHVGCRCRFLAAARTPGVPAVCASQCLLWVLSMTLSITETNRIRLVLFGIQNRLIASCLVAIHGVLISAM